MRVDSVGHGPHRIHDRPLAAQRAAKPAEDREVRREEPVREAKHTEHEAAYAREVDVRRKLDAAEGTTDARRLAKEFKQLGKALSREILAEGRAQGLDEEQMQALKDVLHDFRHTMKDALWHDRGHRGGHDAPRSADEVVEAFTVAMESLAADLEALVGGVPEEPDTEPGVVDPPEVIETPEAVKPAPVEIEAVV